MLLIVKRFQFKDLGRDLDSRIKDFDGFKTVLRTISMIQSSNISTELRLHKIQEIFAILRDYKILVSVYKSKTVVQLSYCYFLSS